MFKISFPSGRTVVPALIVVDMQNGFVAKGGSYDRLGMNTPMYRDDNYFSRGFDEEPTRCNGQYGKATTGSRRLPTESPTFKISMREYEDMVIKVGDKKSPEFRLDPFSNKVNYNI